MTAITTGTRNTAVTELTDTSVGANTVLAIPSQASVTKAPVIKQPGIMTAGELVFAMPLNRCGTAIPTKDIGPANAVTVAASRLDMSIRETLRKVMLTPEDLA